MIKVGDLHSFIINNLTKSDLPVNIRIDTLPESIGGGTMSCFVDIKKIECEDDGSITIVVEN